MIRDFFTIDLLPSGSVTNVLVRSSIPISSLIACIFTLQENKISSRAKASIYKTCKYLIIFLLMMPQFAVSDSVIVHHDVKITHLSVQALRSIFTMRATRWPDQSVIHVFVLPDSHPLHRSFVKTQLNLFPYQLRMIWDRSVYSGAGYPPILVPSVKEMLARVQSTKGSIGYIDGKSLPLLRGASIIEIQ